MEKNWADDSRFGYYRFIIYNIKKVSYTDRLAKALLSKFGAFEEVKLTDIELEPLNEERLDYRTAQIEKQNYNDSIFKLSKQFAEADLIIVAAPYWDGQFPAVLKTYMENIYSIGIKETELIYAEYLDIEGNDAEEILSAAISNIDEM